MSRRPSVFVLALTVGDYFLWNWSLSANHEVLALVSGLTLPPLALVSLWILAVGAMRVVAAFAGSRRAARAGRVRAGGSSRPAHRQPVGGAGRRRRQRRIHAHRRLSSGLRP